MNSFCKTALSFFLLYLLLMFTWGYSYANCITGPWHSTHKTLHLVTTAADAATATYFTQNPYIGFGVGMLAGLSREQYKINIGASCEWASLTYDIAGSLLGAYGVKHWSIDARANSVRIAYVLEF